jgi:hypothetical protein
MPPPGSGPSRSATALPARALAGAVTALMLTTCAAVLVTGLDTEDRFEVAQSAYSTLR